MDFVQLQPPEEAERSETVLAVGSKRFAQWKPSQATPRLVPYRNFSSRVRILATLVAFELGVLATAGPLLYFVFWLASIAGVWLLIRSIRFDRRPPRGLARLADAPSSTPWIPVFAEFSACGWDVGEDSGLATFCDGFLIFEGLRTSFSLSSERIRLEGVSRFRLTERYSKVVALPWTADEFSGVIRLRAYAPYGDRNAFKKAALQWLQLPVQGSRDLIFPPIEPASNVQVGRLANFWMQRGRSIKAALLLTGLTVCFGIAPTAFALRQYNTQQLPDPNTLRNLFIANRGRLESSLGVVLQSPVYSEIYGSSRLEGSNQVSDGLGLHPFAGRNFTEVEVSPRRVSFRVWNRGPWTSADTIWRCVSISRLRDGSTDELKGVQDLGEPKRLDIDDFGSCIPLGGGWYLEYFAPPDDD